MQSVVATRRRSFGGWLFSLPLLFASPAVLADFVVADPKTLAAEASESVRFSVPFAGGRSPLGPKGKAALRALIPQARGQRVKVVGRPDGKVSEALAGSRASVIREFLVANGVDPANIAIEVDSSANQRPKGGNFSCDVFVSRASSQPAKVAAVPALQPSQPLPAGQFAPRGTSSSATQLQIIQLINRAANSNEMDPAAAIRAIQMIANTGAPQSAGGDRPAQRVEKTTWQLSTAKSLRENLEAWASEGGFNPPEWLASDAYQVTKPVTLNGDFRRALNLVAESTRLNICVYQRSKRIRVTDPEISCKE